VELFEAPHDSFPEVTPEVWQVRGSQAERKKESGKQKEAGLQVSGLLLAYRPLEVNICAMKTLARRSVTAYIRENGDCRHANGE
jgi:hypothetical protein